MSGSDMKHKIFSESGFSLTELLIVLVIMGILIMMALPKLLPVVTKAKTTEAKLNLKQVYILEKNFKYEYDKYSPDLKEISYEQEKLITDGGNARYRIEIQKADVNSFKAVATAVVDFNNNGVFNVWEVKEDGNIKEVTPD
jgi:type IV pilus assembly protein PilE